MVVPEAGKLAIGTVSKYGYLGGALVLYDLHSGQRCASQLRCE